MSTKPQARPMNNGTLRILFLCDAFNSMAQRLYLECIEEGHDVLVHLAKDSDDMIEKMKQTQPHLILCPFLTKRVPEEIWSNAAVPCLIVHPGIEGDRGMSSIDWALNEHAEEWGVTILQAEAEMDAGDIWATNNFKISRRHGKVPTKSSVYRGGCINAAVVGLRQVLHDFMEGKCSPRPLDYSQPNVHGKWRPKMRQANRAVDWTASMHDIASLVGASDSRSGVLDTFYGVQYFMFGAHVEDNLLMDKAPPKTILGKRTGAVLIRCGQGAVWISHLKQRNAKGNKYFKLPAAMALPKEIVDALPYLDEPNFFLEFGTFPKTFQEIFYWENSLACFLWFDFYDGAMSTEQCQRLCKAWDYIQTNSKCKVIIMMGGTDFFSNGIHLNVIEAAVDSQQESWENIVAIDDFVRRVLVCKKLTIAALCGNAGAGGAMLALAADYVWAHGNVVLNPSYKAMDLFGSEYWTYSFPKRCGAKVATELTSKSVPLSASQALKLGAVDVILCQSADGFEGKVLANVAAMNEIDLEDILQWKAQHVSDDFISEIAQYRRNELEKMRECFASVSYNMKRKKFVYKE